MSSYVEEFLYRGRDLVHEGDKAAAFHAVLAYWATGPDGKPQQLKTPPLTPTQAEAQGFDLARILNEVAAAALRERGAALARATTAETEAETVRGEKTQALTRVRELEDELARQAASAASTAEAPGQTIVSMLTFGLIKEL